MRKVYHKYIDLSVLPTINENIDWANSIKVINVNGIKLNVIYVDGMKVGEKKNI